ncbi:hypothetical protein GCM10010182_05900 [Actinomadura cremea]|nr:hypothetical protein GCM10010182_05900 [Actinomadura cremea]
MRRTNAAIVRPFRDARHVRVPHLRAVRHVPSGHTAPPAFAAPVFGPADGALRDRVRVNLNALEHISRTSDEQGVHSAQPRLLRELAEPAVARGHGARVRQLLLPVRDLQGAPGVMSCPAAPWAHRVPRGDDGWRAS